MPILTPGLELDQDTHTYRYKGRVVPSPTGILSCVGVRPRGKDRWQSLSGGEFAADETASAFGTALHQVAAIRVRGKGATYDPALEPWVVALGECLLHEPEFNPRYEGQAHVEESRYSLRYDFAYTPDVWLGPEDQPVILVDWKTSDQWKDHWWLQLGAYAEALRAEFKIVQPPRTVIVQVMKRQYQIQRHTSAQVRADFGRFLSVLNTWRLAA